MAAALPQEATAMELQMPDQVDPLHGNRSGGEALTNNLSAREILLSQRPVCL